MPAGTIRYMVATDRALARGTRRAERVLLELGAEFREARLSLGASQRVVGARVGMSGSKVSRIEAGRLRTVSIPDACRLASVLGLDFAARLYPAGRGLRDEAHAQLLGRLREHVCAPLVWRTEVPLPQQPGYPPEMRAWDAVLLGDGERTAIELEMRLRDAQALERRIAAKRRDDGMDHFLLVIADTRTNRAVIGEHPGMFPDLPRLRKASILKALRAGRHPGTGLLLV